jgi:hypothetical protein
MTEQPWQTSNTTQILQKQAKLQTAGSWYGQVFDTGLYFGKSVL